jgi:GT2 family glycosyltransferase
MKPTYIVLLNWNGWRDTVECLTTLKSLDASNYRMLVVDNGSGDDSLAQLRSAFQDLAILESPVNLGFAAGCNLGLRHCLQHGAEYIWLLNNDTKADPQSLRAMVEKLESDPNTGAVGSAIYSMARTEKLLVWGGGHVDCCLGRALHFDKRVSDERVQYLTGASLLLRRSAIEKVGLLDEQFFMYWEDADYCFRLRKAGWRLAVAGESRIWHKEQGSVGKRSVPLDIYFNQSAVRFFKKHASVPFAPVWISLGQRIARWTLAGDLQRARAVWMAVREP